MLLMNSTGDQIAQPFSESVADAAYFFRRFLQNPRHVASIIPSSRFLAAAMFADLSIVDGDVIVEFGPGTGAFTREVQRLRDSGLDIRYLGIERDAGLFRRLCARFPELDFQHGDVCDAQMHVASRDLGAVNVVISGLPLVLMPEEVLDTIFAGMGNFLHSDGVFRTFSYVNNYPTVGAARLRNRLRSNFADCSVSRPVIRNLPPAYVLSGRRPITGCR
jgi:phosphatidylethanolamine/phosphatidyl-N-methylethanolamine N-methyltransferase